MNARDRFAALVQQPEVPLAVCCVAIAEHLGHPALELEVTTRLDEHAATVARGCELSGVEVDLRAVARTLFDDPARGGLGFRGDATQYHDVRNSLLPEVIDRRKGIPITLSIVVIEVARRLGLAAVGVGMPGHFLVGQPGDDLGSAPVRWLDAFDGGRWLDRRGALERFRALHGPGPRFDPSYLGATPAPQIVARVLNNLAVLHQRAGDVSARVRVLELRALVPDVESSVRASVELAEAYALVGRVADAISTLSGLRDQVDPRRRGDLERRLGELRARLN